jgi:MFS family permease
MVYGWEVISLADNQKSTIPAVVALSLALGIRQVSMTSVMPFISTYCKSLAGYTAFYAGLAVGIFGLMQAIFQIPFGVLSDRYGNKRLMLAGLTMVVAGLVLAFFARSVGMLILARALQGSGAIIGVGYSWAAGMAGEEERIRAMSILGAFISAGAALAFAMGPLLRQIMPVKWMFLMCALLLFLNELYILFFVRDKTGLFEQRRGFPDKKQVGSLLSDKNFVMMNLSAFFNNYMMISVFYAVPIYLTGVTGETGMWKIFIPSIFVAILAMKAAVREFQKGFGRQILAAAFLVSALSILLYFRKTSYVFLLLGTALFLCGYITIATLTASNVNEAVDDGCRGTANGIFNSFQYIGNFAGAAVTGALWGVSEPLTWFVTIGIGLVGFFMTIYGKKPQVCLKEESGK